MDWERARSEEQKEYRIKEIIEATAALYESRGFEEISLAMIAREARFTRSNLYKYFTTKEDIFLELIKYDFKAWSRDLELEFRDKEEYSPVEFSETWVRITIKHKRFLRLHSILYTVLEKHSSEENLKGFKTAIKEVLTDLSRLLCRVLKSMTPEKALEFLYLQTAEAVGLYPMTNPTDKQLKAMAEAGWGSQAVDFETYFRRGIEYLLKGILG